MMWKIIFHMYMDESKKMDEIFGWTSMNFLDDNYK